jgi:diacylglycerol kinase
MAIEPRQRIHSFRFALVGLAHSIRRETNFQIELFLGVLALILAAWLSVTPLEWCIIIVLIGFVLTIELVNTSFERLSDLQKPRLDPLVKAAKDVSAAAVLVASLTALAVGIIIFLPRLIDVFAILK